jgi:ribulose-5-phosphate 4-epimerase/fuculose-1-phosphate aldolase
MNKAASYPSERRLVALACRVLAIEELAETTLGHVSLRVGGTHLLVRARRASERSLLFTTADDVVLTDLDGNLPVFGEDYHEQVWRSYAAKAERVPL